jgi:hypothetical protein
MIQDADVVARISSAIQDGRAITFCQESPDNHYPEVKWQMFGLIDTKEIAVTARCGDLRFGISQSSWLLYPEMVDRIFGMDVSDQELAAKLADELWRMHASVLIELAQRIRSGT